MAMPMHIFPIAEDKHIAKPKAASNSHPKQLPTEGRFLLVLPQTQS